MVRILGFLVGLVFAGVALISFGGSSLVSTLASLGILMNVSEHAG